MAAQVSNSGPLRPPIPAPSSSHPPLVFIAGFISLAPPLLFLLCYENSSLPFLPLLTLLPFPLSLSPYADLEAGLAIISSSTNNVTLVM